LTAIGACPLAAPSWRCSMDNIIYIVVIVVIVLLVLGYFGRGRFGR
jgi:hypothetical protein